MPRAFQPPFMDHRIRVRNPADRPVRDTDEHGVETPPQPWGFEVWAARRDRSPTIDLSADQTAAVPIGQVVWTIRYRQGIAPDAEIVHDGTVYDMQGPPLERGGIEYGTVEKFLELHTERRSGQPTT